MYNSSAAVARTFYSIDAWFDHCGCLSYRRDYARLFVTWVDYYLASLLHYTTKGVRAVPRLA